MPEQPAATDLHDHDGLAGDTATVDEGVPRYRGGAPDQAVPARVPQLHTHRAVVYS